MRQILKIRTLSVIAALLLFSNWAWGVSINPTHSGSWYNPNQSGHGLSVEVMDATTTIIYWYVYHLDGTPQFLITIGQNQGNKTSGTTYYQSGMTFGDFNRDNYEQVEWGTATFTVTDCQNATFEYQANDPDYGSGSVQMVRLISIQGVKCTNNPVQGTYQISFASDQNGPLDILIGQLTIFENGDAALFGTGQFGVVGLGQISLNSERTFQFNGVTLDYFGNRSSFVGSGVFADRTLNIDWNGSLGERAQVQGAALQSFQKPISYALASKTWDVFDPSAGFVIGQLNLDNAGNITGTDTYGCQYAGYINIRDPNFNQFTTYMQVSNCAYQVELIGAGILILHDDPQLDGMIFMMSDSLSGRLWYLQPGNS
jgi:hypothetical protein